MTKESTTCTGEAHSGHLGGIGRDGRGCLRLRPAPPGVARWLVNRQEEIDSAFEYMDMDDDEPRPNVADIYRRLAAVEETHATFWEHRLRETT